MFCEGVSNFELSSEKMTRINKKQTLGIILPWCKLHKENFVKELF